MDEIRFSQACAKIVGTEHKRQGIGTLQEKTVHAVLKHYYAPDEDMHEIPIGHYVADIYTGSEIIEIQTAQLGKMRAKLTCFLADYPVTIVHPIPHHKWLSWVDVTTGDCSKPRKSPKTGNIYRAFGELYRIKEYLTHENLCLCFPLVDMEEYRLLNGWSHNKKKGSVRFDRIPLSLVDEIRFERREDYLQLIPYDLKEPFTAADFGVAVGIDRKTASLVLNILTFLATVIRNGKSGNSYLYTVNNED
ncbi:MAG: hypothetical protein LBV33_02710 [Lachnospiraceae bacterium]|jgi:hypothetical protein|nr:hypothetical protein [Lachnospiraceae bacterium]